MNPKRATSRDIIENLRAGREKLVFTYKGNPIRLSADLSAEI